MNWLRFIPSKATLVLLFKVAKKRVAEETDDVAKLSDARIESATEELHQIANDIRDAPETPEGSPADSHTTDHGSGIPPDPRPK